VLLATVCCKFISVSCLIISNTVSPVGITIRPVSVSSIKDPSKRQFHNLLFCRTISCASSFNIYVYLIGWQDNRVSRAETFVCRWPHFYQ